MRAPNCATGPLCVDRSILAHGRGAGNLIVNRRRSGGPAGLGRLTRVSEHQPSGQQVGRLFRRCAIEGHQGCRHSGQASEMRPPSVANEHDLNLIGTAGDDVFEAMNVHRRSMVFVGNGSRDLTRTLRGVKRSAARRRRPQVRRMRSARLFREEKSALSVSAQLLHDSCTAFPHLRLKLTVRAEKRSSR
jgi:hypothetical protein